jgi:hypothetical protein
VFNSKVPKSTVQVGNIPVERASSLRIKLDEQVLASLLDLNDDAVEFMPPVLSGSSSSGGREYHSHTISPWRQRWPRAKAA